MDVEQGSKDNPQSKFCILISSNDLESGKENGMTNSYFSRYQRFDKLLFVRW